MHRSIRRTFALLACFVAVPSGAEVLYEENGVAVEYSATDTGRSTACSLSPERDANYSTKKVKVWKVALSITNGADRGITDLGPLIATVNVESDKGSIFDYCWFERVPGLHRIDGQSDHYKAGFGIAPAGVETVPPGRTLSNSTYLYLYDDRRPVLADWSFGGYSFVPENDKNGGNARHGEDSKVLREGETPATESSDAGSPDAVSVATGPSASLVLLMDVSGSMSGAKLDAARRAAIDTVRKALRGDTEVAVLSFEGDCDAPIRASVGFTRDAGEAVAFIEGLEALGGTPLSTALAATGRFMEAGKASGSGTQMILLLADGDDDCGGVDEALESLAANNQLYRHETVGLEVSDLARRQLEAIAARSGGRYHAATSDNLSRVFSDVVELANMLDMIGRFRARPASVPRNATGSKGGPALGGIARPGDTQTGAEDGPASGTVEAGAAEAEADEPQLSANRGKSFSKPGEVDFSDVDIGGHLARRSPDDADEHSCWETRPNCVTATSEMKGTQLRMQFHNQCGGRVYLHYCAQRLATEEHPEHCGSTGLRDGGRTWPEVTSAHNATGKFRWEWIGVEQADHDWVCAGKVPDWGEWPVPYTY